MMALKGMNKELHFYQINFQIFMYFAFVFFENWQVIQLIMISHGMY